jgi:hypothetical protein
MVYTGILARAGSWQGVPCDWRISSDGRLPDIVGDKDTAAPPRPNRLGLTPEQIGDIRSGLLLADSVTESSTRTFALDRLLSTWSMKAAIPTPVATA